MSVRNRLGVVAGLIAAFATLVTLATGFPAAVAIDSAATTQAADTTQAAAATQAAATTRGPSGSPTATASAAATQAAATTHGPSGSPTATASAAALGPLVSADRTPWTGGMDLYRPGAFATQGTWLWCTAADVQIIRNIVSGDSDHGWAAQQAYFDWMRRHNRYAIPVTDGVDPAGWAAGLRQFVDPGYRVVASASFDASLRAAVTSLRLTGLPVGLLVAHGNHAWILTGFTATADPASTSSFRVTSVNVVGPLYGRQSRGGYDMPPDTRLSPAELARFLTPFRDPVRPMIWDGMFVTVDPGAAGPTAP